ncbi:hypothetical protein CQ010_01425 [Arthrobacter sp. MYb211]|uniref:hypothetical protein n=1 Tax=unclassified Arthrobacter TaxID=235627 RepID=UPI000CFBFAE1|nr:MULTISPECIES: hypothetical protein [unclassified Arthrobacter]PRA13335.1 hypothetical protein CQ015_03680 [Arthrobacter sp. MYb221]PRC10532.1 hypothetical protein CQ010_01425 [Arthrobacter sp. MYb211]
MTPEWDPAWGDRTELAQTVAQRPYAGDNTPCPWEAVAPIAQTMLRARASALLADVMPVLIAAGWKPPKRKS